MGRVCRIAIFLGLVFAPAAAQMREPRSAAEHNRRGNARYAKGDAAGAIADYTRAITLRPKQAEAFLNRANVLYAQGDLDGAIADYTTVIALEPQNAGAYLSRAAARLKKGDITGARQDSSQAAAINPNAPDVSRSGVVVPPAAVTPNAVTPNLVTLKTPAAPPSAPPAPNLVAVNPAATTRGVGTLYRKVKPVLPSYPLCQETAHPARASLKHSPKSLTPL